jgi:hypothetical protein
MAVMAGYTLATLTAMDARGNEAAQVDDQVREADYVVIGAGASAMAFADVIVTDSDRTLIIVDQHAQPGGHWNHAYPFVRLHQPSAFYGVSSRPLGRHVRDASGPNAGLYEQATGGEVLAYFDEVLREQFLPTGRVTFLPMSEYLEDGTVLSTLTGRRTRVRARRCVVDASYFGSDVPSIHTPKFPIGEGVSFIPINGLVSVKSPPPGFVVLGAGKTSMDACAWLLEQGVDAEKIVWVRPQDLWLLNRARIQPEASQLSAFADMLEACAKAEGITELITRFEAAELLLRIDRTFWPTTFRGATAAPREIEELRRIEQVVRLGHVTSLETGVAHLEQGDLQFGEDWIVVDCTAEGLRRRPNIPVFQRDRITLQYLQIFGHPTYSAATTARIELSSDDDAAKNDACPSLPAPDELRAIPLYVLTRLELPEKWSKLPGVQEWSDAVRLNAASWALADVDPQDAGAQRAILRIIEDSAPARENLRNLLDRFPT